MVLNQDTYCLLCEDGKSDDMMLNGITSTSNVWEQAIVLIILVFHDYSVFIKVAAIKMLYLINLKFFYRSTLGDFTFVCTNLQIAPSQTNKKWNVIMKFKDNVFLIQ